MVVAALSLVVLIAGVALLDFARSPPAANAAMLLATIGAVCLILSVFAWVLG